MNEGLLGNGWFDQHALRDKFSLQLATIARSTGTFMEVTISEETLRYFPENHLCFLDILNNVGGLCLDPSGRGLANMRLINADPSLLLMPVSTRLEERP